MENFEKSKGDKEIEGLKRLNYFLLIAVFIFMTLGVFAYFENPVGIPCSSIKRQGVTEKSKNGDSVNLKSGDSYYLLAWPLRHGHGGAWTALKDVKNGIPVASEVCGNKLVKVVLDTKEVYLITSEFEREQNMKFVGFDFCITMLFIAALIVSSHRIKSISGKNSVHLNRL